MTDDLVKRLRGWPAVIKAESIMLEAADAIEALQAERCVEVKPLEWVQDEEFGKCYLKAETAFGVVRCVPEDMPKFTGRHVEAVMRFITTRPASEVRAEAHAAAIEAAASIYEGAFDSLAGLIRDLHTDASRDWLAERDERIKREAREEALREAAKQCERAAYSGEYPQDDAIELGCLRSRDFIRTLHTDASRAAIERIKREALEKEAEG